MRALSRGIPTLLFLGIMRLLGTDAAHAEELAKLSIGTILPLTGPQAAFGKEATRGLDLAAEMLKQKDPALAARIQLVPADDLSTTKGAGDAADQLFEKEHVNLLIGSVTAASTSTLTSHRHQLPLIAPLATQSLVVAGSGTFRSCLSEGLEGAILAQFALTTLGIKQAATFRQEGSYAQAFVDRFVEAFKAGGGVITADVTYDLAKDDYAPQLKKIKESGAKLIVTPASYQTAAAIMQQAKKAAPGLPIAGGDSWDTPLLNKTAGAAATGHYFVTHFASDDPDAAVVEFTKAFQQKYGRAPGAIAALMFDSYNLAVDSFKRARTNLRGPLTAALDRTKELAGVTGAMTFDGGAGEPRKAGIIKETTPTVSKFKARVVTEAKPQVAADPKGPAPKG